MSYIINTNTFASNFLPTRKRLSIYTAFVRTLLYPLQILFDTLFGTYKDGNSASDYSNVTAYSVGDQVQYNKSIFQCWVSSTGNIPTNSSYWFLVQSSFVGIEPRLKYNAQHLNFEWSLNEWFDTTFVNTPSASDIYIETNPITSNIFWSGANELDSSYVVSDNADIKGWIQAIDLTDPTYNFTIFVPVAVSDTWTNEAGDTPPSISSNREKILRQQADKYTLAGTQYNIETY
jgi:hypothetical protein